MYIKEYLHFVAGIYKLKNETEPVNGLVYNLIKNKKVKREQ